MSDDPASRLSRIDTVWTIIRDAHGLEAAARSEAQREFLIRYEPAIIRYLQGLMRSGRSVHEDGPVRDVFDAFVEKLLTGGFRNASPERGQFRKYLKTCLINEMRRYWTKKARDKEQIALDAAFPSGLEPAAAEQGPEAIEETQFDRMCGDVVLEKAWQKLRQYEVEKDRPYYTLLRLRSDSPDAGTAELATELSRERGVEFTEPNVRKILQRARQKFADLLVDDVAESLATENIETIEAELIELGLHPYCRSSLDRRRQRPS
jgi:RNA polymerase sigma-70 factor (ECF subfamily)